MAMRDNDKIWLFCCVSKVILCCYLCTYDAVWTFNESSTHLKETKNGQAAVFTNGIIQNNNIFLRKKNSASFWTKATQ